MKINYTTIMKDDNLDLRKKSEEVQLPLSKEDEHTLLDLLTYVRNSTDEEIAEKENLRPAVGIAAPQIGVFKKLMAIVIEDEDGEVEEYAMANPKIVSHSIQQAYLKNGEGCLSVENVHEGYVPRYYRVTIEGYDLLRDQVVKFKVKDFTAIVFQHELDHFTGTLFYDRINKKNPFQEIENAIIID